MHANTNPKTNRKQKKNPTQNIIPNQPNFYPNRPNFSHTHTNIPHNFSGVYPQRPQSSFPCNPPNFPQNFNYSQSSSNFPHPSMTPMGYGDYGAASGYFPSQQPNLNILESNNVISEEEEANEESEDESVGSGSSSGKRTRDEGDNSSPTTPTSVSLGDARLPRAERIKKAKLRLKGKALVSDAVMGLENFSSRVQLFGDSMNASNEADMKRLEMQERKEARKQRQIELEQRQIELEQRQIELEQYRINWEQISRLEQKVNREQWDDEMIVILRYKIQRFNSDA